MRGHARLQVCLAASVRIASASTRRNEVVTKLAEPRRGKGLGMGRCVLCFAGGIYFWTVSLTGELTVGGRTPWLRGS
jgi:hypothetical protein